MSKQSKAAWYREHKADAAVSHRAVHYAKKYGITIREYDALLAAQGGHCALCSEMPGRRRLHVDHNHATGKVRGLLCLRCNIALERVETIIHWAQGALIYTGQH